MDNEKKVLMFRDQRVDNMTREELLVAIHAIMDMYDRERHKQTLDMWEGFNKAQDRGRYA